MGKSSSPPPAPDPYEVARAQGAENKETAVAQAHLNNPNITNPMGRQTVTWTQPTPRTREVFDEDRFNEAQRQYEAATALRDVGGSGENQVVQNDPNALPPDRANYRRVET